MLVADRYEILTIKGGEVVIDHKTGLMWQQDNVEIINWSQANKYAKNLKLGGFSDWRLPTIDELKTLIVGVPEGKEFGEEKKGFGENGSYWQKGVWKYGGNAFGCFWSSSERSGYEGYAKHVDFFTGSVGNVLKSYPLDVRCVRKP